MIDSLHIKGFRGFKELIVPSLGRVNLLVGKNNVGKTTVLDAVELYGAGDEAGERLADLLYRRDEFALDHSNETAWGNLNVSAVFHDGERRKGLPPISSLSIGPVDSSPLEVQLGWYWKKTIEDQTTLRFVKSKSNELDEDQDYFPALQTSSSKSRKRLHPLSRSPWKSHKKRKQSNIPTIFLGTGGFSDDEIVALWNAVVLSPSEDIILQSLRILEPQLVDVRLVLAPQPDSDPETVILVRLEGRSMPQPLRSLGGGMMQVFEFALALVNAKGGNLLIDEFDMGIHYSILAQLWTVIFTIAEKLDVQVFATTHSWDCITSFQEAASESPATGALIHLARRGEITKASVFSEKELETITRQSIEVR